MKRLIIAIALCFLTITYMKGQSKELKRTFHEIQAILSEYKIISAHVSHYENFESLNSMATKNIKILISNKILDISFIDYYINGTIETSYGIVGKKSISMPIDICNFELKYIDCLYFKCNSGIEKTELGKKELVKEYYFEMSELTAQMLKEKLNRLKELIISENFTGTLGAITTKNIGNGTRKQQIKKSKSGKYGE